VSRFVYSQGVIQISVNTRLTTTARIKSYFEHTVGFADGKKMSGTRPAGASHIIFAVTHRLAARVRWHLPTDSATIGGEAVVDAGDAKDHAP